MSKEQISKRILGFISFTIGLIMAVISGLDFYNVEPTIIFVVFGYSATLLGLDTWKHIKTDKQE